MSQSYNGSSQFQLENLSKQFQDLEDKLDYLENQNRRNNIRISGIKENRNESWEATEFKVKSLLKESLELDEKNIIIERAHRTGKSKNGKPKQIVAKLLNYKDKETILKSSRKLKGSGIYINEDFSARVVKRRSEQQEALYQARREGKIAYFNVDRLVIKERSSSCSHSSVPFGFPGSRAEH